MKSQPEQNLHYPCLTIEECAKVEQNIDTIEIGIKLGCGTKTASNALLIILRVPSLS